MSHSLVVIDDKSVTQATAVASLEIARGVSIFFDRMVNVTPALAAIRAL
jgi:hypothetical protein